MIGAVDDDATLVFLGNVDERVSFLGNVDDLTGAVEDGRTTRFEGSSGVAAFLAVVVFFSLPASIVGPFFTSTFTPPRPPPPDTLIASVLPPESLEATKGLCLGKGEGDCLLTLATSLLSKLSVLSPFTMLCLLLSLVDLSDERKEKRLEGAAGKLPASPKEPFGLVLLEHPHLLLAALPALQLGTALPAARARAGGGLHALPPHRLLSLPRQARRGVAPCVSRPSLA